MRYLFPAACLKSSRPIWLAGVLALLATSAAHPVNPAFQDFFFDACGNPAGALAQRCAETIGGAGDLSGDSESSLNPSQTLGSASAARSAAQTRAGAGRGAAETPASPAGESAALSLGPFSLLVNGRHIGEQLDRRVDADAERGYRMHAWSAQLGLDYRVNPALVIGGLLSWETSSLDFDRERPGVAFTPVGRAGSVDQDSLGLTLFANVQLSERIYLDIGAGYVDSDLTIERNAVFQESRRGIPQTAVHTRGKTDGREHWATLMLGYGVNWDAWQLNPYLGITHQQVRVDGYRERDLNGSGLALSVSGQTASTRLAQAGFRLSRAVSREGYVLLPQLSVEYLHELRRDGVRSTVSLQLDGDGNRLRLRSDRRDSGYFDVGAGLVLLMPNGWMSFIEYQTSVGHDDLDRDRIALGIRVEL